MSEISKNSTPVTTELTPVDYLTGVIKRENIKIIGVWGPSGSGKTTFSQVLSETLGADTSFVWKVENYWQYTRPELAERGLTGYHWEARDKQRFLRDLQHLRSGETVESPVFDNIREVPTDRTVTLAPKDVIILEDTLDFSEIVDLGVFIYAPDAVLIERRIARDANQTGLGSITELETYIKTKSLPAYKSTLLPSMPKADYILDTHAMVLYEKRQNA